MSAMNRCLKPDSHGVQAGFTLIELIVVIAVLGVVSAVVMMRGASPAAMTVPSQAQTLASDIRHVQAVSTSLGRRMRITFTSGGYVVSCSDGLSPCPPAFSVTLQKGVTLSTIGVTPLDFDSLGRPLTSAGVSTAASYTLAFGADAKTVSVAALTGFVANP